MRSSESQHQRSALPRRKLLLTETDLARLKPMVKSAKRFLKGRHYIELIDQVLADAGIVAPDAVPQDVVNIHTTALVTDLDRDQQAVYTVVFPQEAKHSDHRISLMTPLGAALLGGCTGDIVEVAGERLRIDQVTAKAP
jgi:regulator of nucleoside diphosphate kinase